MKCRFPAIKEVAVALVLLFANVSVSATEGGLSMAEAPATDSIGIACDSLKVGKAAIDLDNDGIDDRQNDIDKRIADSLRRTDKNYWKRQLLRGKLDLKDKSIIYPKFVKVCVDFYNWADKTFNSYDPEYVVGTGKRWKLMAKTDNWIDNYDLHFPKSTPVRIMSNVCNNAGAYIAYMAVSVGYMFDVDNVFGNKPITHKKWDFNFSCALISADLYYASNTGSTQIRRFGDYKEGKWINHPLNDMRLESYGADIYYFFNHKRYSQGAAYNFSKIQKRSAGSLIAGVTISSQDVSLDFSNLPNSMIAVLPEYSSNLRYRFRYYDYCVLVGYGFNCVIDNHWLFNITALPSLGFKHCLDVSEEGENNIFSANIKAKMSFVYNHKQLFAGMLTKMDMHWYSSRRYNFFNSLEYVNFVAGFRF